MRRYGSFCGTSSATPVVAGLAALAFSLDPLATPAEVAQALERAAVPLPSVVRSGRIDAAATLAAIRGATESGPAVSTAVVRGTVGGRVRARVYSFAVGAGPVSATLAFDGGGTLRLSLRRSASERPIARASGPSGVTVGKAVPAGRVRLVVDRTRSARRFVLTVKSAQRGVARALH